jgi:Flp pilus assembly pilin Flp
MRHALSKVSQLLWALRFDAEGQDLVEYALLMCLICLSLISGINGIATAVNSTFSKISSSLA